MSPRACTFVCTALAALTFTTAVPARSQVSPATSLGAIDSLIAQGRIDPARAALRRWIDSNSIGPGADGTTRAHALFLRGVLAASWADAEADFLAVALSHPTSPHAPLALLRLGQGLFTSGQSGDVAAATRATGYLERLANDYPGTPVRAHAFLWLASAFDAAASSEKACSAATSASRAATDEETRALARVARTRICSAAATAATDSAATEMFAVQIGAFRARESAHQLAARSRDAGFDARIITLEGGSLFRVRAGSFTSMREAESFAARLRIAGFDTAIVNDVRFEIIAR